MIGRENRFHGRGSLQFVYKHGKIVRSPLVSLKYCENHRRKTYRLAVVVSRKVHKSAVVRNRIRRRIYEIIRKHHDQLVSPYDMTFIVYNDQLAAIPAPEIEQIITDLLERAAIFQKDNNVPLETTPAHAIVNSKETT